MDVMDVALVKHELNYKHLRYFWMVARVGTIAGAARLLNLSPHAISAQLGTFEAAQGVSLFRRAGRRLELTEAGERILGHADEIFALGDQIGEILRDGASGGGLPFRIGITDSVPKSIASRLIEPALQIERPGRVVCREGTLASLLGELAVHRLDLVIADRPVPSELSVRAYGSLLSDSTLTAFAAPGLAGRLKGEFPRLLNNAPFLMPGVDVAFRVSLQQWFEASRLRPRIVAEFDDSALMKALGQSGAGVFVAPTTLSDHIRVQYRVVALGEVASVRSQVHAITTERRQSHPAMMAIHERAARELGS
jgi:LysR family transcriptional activator of nhaA